MVWLPGLEPPTPAQPDGDGDEWYTPPAYVRAISASLGGIDLDPCSAPASPVKARHRIDVRSGGDGLTDRWPGSGGVFCNPPYSDVGPWLARCRAVGRDRHVVAMVPARTEIRAWHEDVWPFASVVFPRRRPRFVAPDGRVYGSGKVAIALVCWSPSRTNWFASRLVRCLEAEGIESIAVGVLP
jgi:hypothetical protein